MLGEAGLTAKRGARAARVPNPNFPSPSPDLVGRRPRSARWCWATGFSDSGRGWLGGVHTVHSRESRASPPLFGNKISNKSRVHFFKLICSTKK